MTTNFTVYHIDVGRGETLFPKMKSLSAIALSRGAFRHEFLLVVAAKRDESMQYLLLPLNFEYDGGLI
jgi:hypothetical protein